MAHAHRRLARASPSASSTARRAAGRTIYREGIAALGADFLDGRRRRAGPPPATRSRELRAAASTTHACEGAYGAPEYGGNRDGAGWRAIQFPGDVQPRGYTDEEVRGRA